MKAYESFDDSESDDLELDGTDAIEPDSPPASKKPQSRQSIKAIPIDPSSESDSDDQLDGAGNNSDDDILNVPTERRPQLLKPEDLPSDVSDSSDDELDFGESSRGEVDTTAASRPVMIKPTFPDSDTNDELDMSDSDAADEPAPLKSKPKVTPSKPPLSSSDEESDSDNAQAEKKGRQENLEVSQKAKSTLNSFYDDDEFELSDEDPTKDDVLDIGVSSIFILNFCIFHFPPVFRV